MKIKKIRKTLANVKTEADFKNIDIQLLLGLECNQYDNENKKFLSMIKEQTNSAIENKKYWNTNYLW